MGPLLILVFAVWLKWLPVSGREGVGALILPSLTLGSAMAAILSRMVRAALLGGSRRGLHQNRTLRRV